MMSIHTIIRGPILNPREDGGVTYIADGALAGDANGRIEFAGEWNAFALQLGRDAPRPRLADGFILPPFLDAHIHIPQHPIRGRFMEGLDNAPAEGRLLWGLKRNVFPAEGRCNDESHVRGVVKAFLEDTLAKGVVGGAAYMTVHPAATRIALEMLPATWSVGLVLMNQNCPEYLRTDESTLDEDIRSLAEEFGARLIVTDRFAVAVNSPLRRRAAVLAETFKLRMQTHLNEQISEKRFVEETLYPEASSYTDVYKRDGLLDRKPILAHCVRMSVEEFDLVAEHDAAIAHCPVSNTLLGSGVMPLDVVMQRRIPFALCTDVGASPTTSLMTEMVQFLRVHTARTSAASAERALCAVTRRPAEILGLNAQLGSFERGMPMSFIEVARDGTRFEDANSAILDGLLSARGEVRQYQDNAARCDAMETLACDGLQASDALTLLSGDIEGVARRLNDAVRRVTLSGKLVWEQPP